MATTTHPSQQNQWKSLQLPSANDYQDQHEQQPYFHLQSQPMTKASSAPYNMPRQQPSSLVSRRHQNREQPGPLTAPLDLASAYHRYTLPTSGQVSPLSGPLEPQPMSRKRSHEIFTDSDSSPVMMGFATPMTAVFTWGGGGDMMGTPTKRVCADSMGIEYGYESPFQQAQAQRHEISEYMPLPAELPYTPINHFGMVPMNASEDPFSATGPAAVFPGNYDMNQGHFAPPAMAQTYGDEFDSSPVEEHFQIPEYSLRIQTHQSNVYLSPPIDYSELMQQQQGGFFPANYNLAPTAAPAPAPATATATAGTEGAVLPRAMSTPALSMGGWTSQEVSPRRGVSTAASLAPETPLPAAQVQLQASPVKTTKAKSRAPKKKTTAARKVVDLVFQNFDASHAHKICSAVAPSGSSKAKKKAEEVKRLARMMAKERKGSDASELSSVVEEEKEKGEEGATEA
ncbi:hypothetical protein YB2330_005040 [Saitoella coloradoensis]